MAAQSPLRRNLQSWLFHPLQGALAYLFYGLFRSLPVDAASALGGWIGRTLGPRLGASNRARHNIARAFPDLDRAGIETIVIGMWDNLGRLVGEFPHIPDFHCDTPRLEVVGREYFEALRDDGRPGICFSAHLGNWELNLRPSEDYDCPLASVYRAADNVWVERLYRHARRGLKGSLIPKGARGARQLTATLRDGGHLAMLVDQKMNDGIAIPFFGHPAMTAPALAQFALKYDCVVLPARIERRGGARFRLIFDPPMALPDTGERARDVETLMTQVNARIETWIRAHPEQWLWLHRRWPKA